MNTLPEAPSPITTNLSCLSGFSSSESDISVPRYQNDVETTDAIMLGNNGDLEPIEYHDLKNHLRK